MAVAPHSDLAGIAGVGGTVATPFLFRTDLTVSQIITGVQLCTAWGVDVINLSITIQVVSFGPFDSFPDDDFNDMFSWARSNGVVNFGNDTIADFAAGQDHLQIDHTIFGNFAAVQQHMQQVGGDVVITYDANNSITLHDAVMANLHASDFLFV